MQNQKSQASSQKCPSCGGDLVFSPQKQMLECVQCGNLTAIPSVITTEKSFETLLKNAPQWQNDTVVFRCENCGAKAVVSRSDLAVKCDYCGATNIIKIEDFPGLRPDAVAVFNLSKEEAVGRAKKILSKKFFAPRWYKRSVNTKHLNGVYYPVFTFDAQTASTYTGVQVVTETQTVYVDGKPIVRTNVHRFPISGRIEQDFDDIVIPASETIPDRVIKNLQPFNTNEANQYKKEYLSGFKATHYTKDALQCWQDAQNHMDYAIRRRIQNQYGTVESLSLKTKISNVTYKYVLLPIYVGHSEYEGEKYELYVNGQTGKVSAKTPISIWKVLLVTALGVAAVGGAIALALLL